MADKLTRRNGFNQYTLTTPLGTSTINSRQEETISALAGANEVVILSGTGTGGYKESYFVKHEGAEGNYYYNYIYVRPQNTDYSYTYDVQWTPSSNTISIRLNQKGSSASTPKIYSVLYR